MDSPMRRPSTSRERDPLLDGDDDHSKSEPAKRACLACRTVKMRCLPQEPAGHKCARCERLHQECVWAAPQKRGRKPKGHKLPDPPLPLPSSSASASASSSAFHSPAALYYAAQAAQNPLDLLAASALPNPPAHFTSTAPTLPPFPPPPTFPPFPHPHPQTLSASTSAHHSPSTLSEVSPAANLSLVDVARAKEEALSKLSAGAPTTVKAGERAKAASAMSQDVVPDVVDLGILTLAEAESLFAFFFGELNRYIILFDKYLHTLAFVRSTSTVLFAALLAVSAKFARPDLYPPLLANAQQLIGRGIVEARASVGLIQAILTLIYWKPPTDMSAWLRVGVAIRMALQLDLNVGRNGPLPADEHEARLILDIERTWHVLICFDGTYLLHSGDGDDGVHQTYMIPHYNIHMEAWLEETRPYGVTDDLEQGAAFEWIKVLRLSKDIAHARPMQARALASHLHGMLDATYRRYLDPTSPHTLHTNRRSALKVTFFIAAANLALRRATLVSTGTMGVTLAHFMVAACELVDAFEEVVKEGMVRYWQDNLAVTMFGLGEFLVKIFHRVYPSNQTQILTWMERVYQACELATEGKEDSVAAFMSRFFKLGIRVLCSPPPPTAHADSAPFSSLGSPAPGLTAPLHPPVVPAPSTSTALAPPRLLPVPPTPVALGASSPLPDGSYTFSEAMGDDRLFWESLFPGQASDWSWLDQAPGEEMVGVPMQ
ncbi:uncharacterized protein RHOBADRAFT_55167 [Rhodotorula graminis WP1]|uniref:Zn(2)-C6 fungal-type domain-containing protein n=1 Tax=Rhodotorula graminis (strain WP1) TaxID=578459 RepID=A0A0P9GJX6_RHOGW|nr:uncharacterized protein RHOBADRAFT_55167 [Rhodotorula graminis WP1]KPV73422.1 hypothetical protein RHOBADRAFT_55167 [Rhodotorula graminis WP1]